MRIQNYEIEPYEYGYMVSEISTKEKGDNIGEEYKVFTKYPKDLVDALKMVRGYKVSQNIKETLTATISAIETADREFLDELKTILSK